MLLSRSLVKGGSSSSSVDDGIIGEGEDGRDGSGDDSVLIGFGECDGDGAEDEDIVTSGTEERVSLGLMDTDTETCAEVEGRAGSEEMVLFVEGVTGGGMIDSPFAFAPAGADFLLGTNSGLGSVFHLPRSEEVR